MSDGLFLLRLLRSGWEEGQLRVAGAVVQLDAEGARDLVRTGRAVLVNDADVPRLLAATSLRQDVPHLRLVKR
jgi:hypothetical protein